MTTVSNDFHKLLVGAFAFVMVSSMVFPAYAGEVSELVIKCYPIDDGQIDPPSISLTNQFGSEQVDPFLPVFTCEIAVKNGISPPFVPQSGIIYPISGSIDPPQVSLTDQFGTEVVDPSPAVWVLVPAVEFDSAEGSPIGVSISAHLTFYPISGTIDPPLVNLVDKFGDDDANASPAQWLGVPTEKNSEGLEDDQHYKCYPFDGTVDPPLDFLEDQFGFHQVDPMTAGFYCTQADKDPVRPLPPVGGEFLPIESTALLLAGLQSSAIWMLPILAVAAGAGAYFVRTRMNKE